MKRNTLVKITTLIFSLFLTLQVNSTNILAQETTDPELEELKKQKEIAETRKAIAEAKKAEIEAKFPIPDADSLKGSTDVKGSMIESQIQAFKAMDSISEKIAEELQQKTRIKKLYVFNETDYQKIVSYYNLIQQLDVINKEYEKCNPTGALGADPAAAGISNILLNSLPLLKTETTISPSSFDIDNETAWASLANKLAVKGISLNNPFISNFDLLTIVAQESDLTSKIDKAEIYSTKGQCSNGGGSRLKNLIDSVYIKLKSELNLEQIDSKPEKTKKTTTKSTIPPTETEIEETEKTPATSTSRNQNIWFTYLLTEQIIKTMKSNNIYWIKIKNIKAGGNMRVKSSPIVDIFRGGSSIKFSGGSLASYYILDNEGKIILSGIVNAYIPYKKSGQIK